MKKIKFKNGITLIALVITIIVMLILVAVTITMAINGGLFDYAGKAARDTETAKQKEQNLANLSSNITTDELIAKFTEESEDLSKLKQYFVGKLASDVANRNEYKDNEVIADANTSITGIFYRIGYEIIQYHDNLYKLTVEVVGEKDRRYTKVEEFTKLDITQAELSESSITMNASRTKDIQSIISNLAIIEDFVVTSNNTSIVTVDGYSINSTTTPGTTTITLTGETSGKTKDITVTVKGVK